MKIYGATITDYGAHPNPNFATQFESYIVVSQGECEEEDLKRYGLTDEDIFYYATPDEAKSKHCKVDDCVVELSYEMEEENDD